MTERESFEAWMRECEGYPYAGQYANLMWKAWQARALLAAGASEGQASSEFVFPPMPHAVVQHEKVGPLFDRLSMQFYAAKCMRSQDAEIAALRERIAGMEKDAAADVTPEEYAEYYHGARLHGLAPYTFAAYRKRAIDKEPT